MNPWTRREATLGGVALVTAMLGACAGPARALTIVRYRFFSERKQGGLVVGQAESAKRATLDGAPLRLSPEGIFAFGLAYDQTKPSRLTLAYGDGTEADLDVTPAVRQYEVQNVTGLPPNLVSPSPEDQQRIQREHALVAEARKADTGETWFAEPFEWPANGVITSLFGSQRSLNGVRSAPHFGVDIAAAEGAPVRAPANAKVLIAQEFLLEGNYTMLDHGHGVFTGYMHQSKSSVKPGDSVERGQQIGLVGKTGRATGPHLHWSLNWFQVRLDPSLSARLPAPANP